MNETETTCAQNCQTANFAHDSRKHDIVKKINDILAGIPATIVAEILKSFSNEGMGVILCLAEKKCI